MSQKAKTEMVLKNEKISESLKIKFHSSLKSDYKGGGMTRKWVFFDH